MKAIVEFNLEDTDDQKNHLRCIKSAHMAAMLWEVRNNLYKQCMNEAELSNGSVADVEEGIDIVFDKLDDLFNRFNIDPEELN